MEIEPPYEPVVPVLTPHGLPRFLWLAAMLALAIAAAARPAAQDPQEVFDRALADFQSGRLDALGCRVRRRRQIGSRLRPRSSGSAASRSTTSDATRNAVASSSPTAP